MPLDNPTLAAQRTERAKASCAPSTCSASERSADQWAETGRKAANLAIEAVERGNHGTAEGHRKTASMCFDMETRLRQMQNADLSGAK